MTTLSEPALKLLRYQSRFSYFNIDRFNDSVVYLDLAHLIREKGLNETLQQILHQVRKTQPGLVCIDSFKAINDLATDNKEVRKFGFDLALKLSAWECTTFLIGEYTEEEMRTESIFAIADGVLELTFEGNGARRRRSLEVVKMRGSDFEIGKHYFEITTDGLRLFPNLESEHFICENSVESVADRVGLQVRGLDEACGGGIPRGTSTLVIGPSGVGKSLVAMSFLAAGQAASDPGLLVSFRQSEAELRGTSAGAGVSLKGNQVEIWPLSPRSLEPERFTTDLLTKVQRTGTKRLVLDSVSELRQAFDASINAQGFFHSLLRRLARQGVTTLLVDNVPELFGARSLSEQGLFTLVDNVLMLQYTYDQGAMKKALLILKMHASDHSRQARELCISNQGLVLADPVEIQWE